MAMQVEPMKPALKAPGIELLKLEYGNPLSSFGFKSNLRRYSKAGNRKFFVGTVLQPGRADKIFAPVGSHSERSPLCRILFRPSASLLEFS